MCDAKKASFEPYTRYMDPNVVEMLAKRQRHLVPNDYITRIKKAANNCLKNGPFSVTYTDRIPPSGDVHDFMTQAPYWWPDSNAENPATAPYIRIDGKMNPECTELPNQKQLENMALCVSTLSLAYCYVEDSRYLKHAWDLLRVWFLDPQTRMNPNVNYGQIRPNCSEGGTFTGMMGTRGLVLVANSVLLIKTAEYEADMVQLKQWFTEYVNWISESELALRAKRARNNHGTFYYIQLVSCLYFLERYQEALDHLKEFFQQTMKRQINQEGDQPHESARATPMTYLVGNLEGLIYLAQIGDSLGFDGWGFHNQGIKRAADFILEKRCCWKYEPRLGMIVRTMIHKYGDQDGKYSQFLEGEDLGSANNLRAAGMSCLWTLPQSVRPA
ncbi:chondroitin AC/alginate lyase [Basidiobolus meristosporus CBS 931.73]|uniref:Chondroitin AC/alginate lyase n=1 Tax=Basidiobolus meristosporus CBS 931.73 TaxID=1314790 RepID=A0A1Y1XG97_9FUNG|nr:chondroitin AC/alginate lyase [Basidiobolus meristosporus CBS 931.73]|eukprot:ORX84781.1 chondroitin AC/alginate lyase [Basidiobolus meristosporus CBS 931.73]